ncbi:MAG: hypothetical protein WEC84_04825 [Candidatus Andersenbacteria bacterium]
MIDWRELRSVFLLLFLMMGLVGLGILVFVPLHAFPLDFLREETPEAVVEVPERPMNGIQSVQPIANPVVTIEKPTVSIFDPVRLESPSQEG